MKHLILVGPQGSGKGTQARILAEKQGYVIFETGGALRALAKEGSDLGNKVAEIMNRGELVSTELVMDIVRDFIEKNEGKKIIFDGIPRSRDQYDALMALFETLALDYTVLSIEVPIEVCKERMMKRVALEGRADDTPEAIEKRLEIFATKTKPLLDLWEAKGKVVAVNGHDTPENVDAEIAVKLQNHDKGTCCGCCCCGNK
ncbi:adenylate kinase [bacterium DOLZORAL124_38_8]|nr:MAG: adenylate kinase [bacterium DOLZORAL124_38_8]